MRELIAMALAVSLAGCSFFMKTTPKNWDGTTPPECSESEAAPAADLTMATLAAVPGALGAYLMLRPECTGYCEKGGAVFDDRAVGTVLLIPALVIGLPYLVSGIGGVRKIMKCRSAKRKYGERERTRRRERLNSPAGQAAEKKRRQEERAKRRAEKQRRVEKRRAEEARRVERRRAEEARRVEVEEEKRQAEECQPLVKGWRLEQRARRKVALRHKMPPACRQLLPPVRPGGHGGYCLGDQKCNDGLVCDSETTRCVNGGP